MPTATSMACRSLPPRRSSLRNSAAAFSAAWVGRWGGELKHILIVERVKDGGTADVVFAWGDAPQLGIKRGWDRPDARIDGNALTLTGPRLFRPAIGGHPRAGSRPPKRARTTEPPRPESDSR